MARYDIYESDSDTLLLDVQADLLDQLRTRTVVPLISYDKAPKPAQRLNPVFDINGKRYVMVTQFMAAVSVGELKTSVTNLTKEHDVITAALDMLFHGF